MPTTWSSDGSQADITAKHTLASPGDVITIPEGTFTWTTLLELSKGVSLQGAGSGRILTVSSSSVAIGTGSKTFTVQTELSTITAGMTLRLEKLGASASYMQGTVTSYNSSTGSLEMNIASTGGSGTVVAWLVATLPQTVAIVNNNSYYGLVFHLNQSAATYLSGIQFQCGPNADRELMWWQGDFSDAQPIHIHDCWFRALAGKNLIRTTSNRGLVYRCSFSTSARLDGGGPSGSAVLVMQNNLNSDPTSNGSWLSAHTFGTADTTGTNNLYIEDCDFHGFANAGTDIGDQGRIVIRHSFWNHSSINSHGSDSGQWGLRHMEVYNNKFVLINSEWNDTQPWWVWVRSGTAVVADNDWPLLSCMMRFSILNLSDNNGPNPIWGYPTPEIEYPCPRQPGRGYINGTSLDGLGRNTDSVGFVGDLEPAYIWGNSISLTVPDKLWRTNGSGADGGVSPEEADSADEYIQLDRDFYFSAKPGYTKYTYPHPLRAEGGGPPPFTPPAVNPRSSKRVGIRATLRRRR